MKIRYIDLIDQSFDFPTEEFSIKNNLLEFHGIPLMNLIQRYGTPLRFTYLPKISQNIKKAKNWFKKAINYNRYNNKYTYCYCTKSSHFSFILEEVIKNNISIETSYAYDIEIVKNLYKNNKIDKKIEVICNGFKTKNYINNISELINNGFYNTIPVLDNYEELEKLSSIINNPFKLGIRIASEEEPKFEFYTSRLGIGYKNIIIFYLNKIKNNPKVNLKMLHFFINTGIKDSAYYWNELFKCLQIYAELKKISPGLNILNIGGGFPIKTSMSFKYDYEYMINEIIYQIKKFCQKERVQEPHIYTEFGTYTVGESGGILYKILSQKRQNDKEKWNMIDSSFMTTLPDTWAISSRFIMMAINRWNDFYERVFLGGLTCDSDDYYNSEQHINAIYLPCYRNNIPLYIGFFNIGAYQDTISGYGGVHHCLMPQPIHILIDKDNKNKRKLKYRIFRKFQNYKEILKILGYKK
ncbi:type III PLP-dependent enzyme domain-containing protein [Blattabacterium cuenoti]|uniref:arginine decarboxylase n=1 Tax=Blattabacterium cuenoti TaxID=1653831 RepID=UPI00163C692A|nr:arginine decarboxylase [Blattabacterium cuenoti]